MRLLFERDLTPHPQYAAFYKWLQHDFNASAVLHFGMHGTGGWDRAPAGSQMSTLDWHDSRDVALGERLLRAWSRGAGACATCCRPALSISLPLLRLRRFLPRWPPAVEWLPGVQLGNTGFSWSDVLLGGRRRRLHYPACAGSAAPLPFASLPSAAGCKALA